MTPPTASERQDDQENNMTTPPFMDGKDAVHVTDSDPRLAAIAKYHPEKLPRLLAILDLIERMKAYRGS